LHGHDGLTALVRALVRRGSTEAADGQADAGPDWLIRSGLGPLLRHLAVHAAIDVPDGWRDRLRAADLLARLETRARIRVVADVAARLRRRGVEVTLLKGIAVATRYYPEPHLRLMGDADLLIPREHLEASVSMLRAQGYRPSTYAEPTWWDHLHHAPPLTHPELGVTIELHHAFLPPTAHAARDPLFDVASLAGRTVASDLDGVPVRRLRPECSLALLAAAWENDLTVFLGEPGLQRALVDAVVLLERAGGAFDWDALRRWTEGTATGRGLWLLLGVLERIGALPRQAPGAARAAGRVRSRPPGIDAAAGRVLQTLVYRHVVGHRPFGRILTVDNTATVLRTLLGRGSASRRWLTLPLAVAFPPSNPKRFQLAFQASRIRSFVGGR
jgi:hypothetical protein